MVFQELESAHMAAAEELESLYEQRLQVETERLKHLKGAKDDLEFKTEETIERLKKSHKQDMQVGDGSFGTQVISFF